MTTETMTVENPAVDMTAAIIIAYVSNNSVPVAMLPSLIGDVHASLAALFSPPAAEPVKLEPPVPIKKTVTPDAIISLEDGKPYKSLRRHLNARGLTPEQYRQKWGLPHDYPMTSENYSATRSELAKSSGLGQKRKLKAVA